MIIKTALENLKVQIRGPRPFEEFKKLLDNAIPIIREDPRSKYQGKKRLGKGAQGKVFLYKRI